jgi:hypothetical protein
VLPFAEIVYALVYSTMVLKDVKEDEYLSRLLSVSEPPSKRLHSAVRVGFCAISTAMIVTCWIIVL